MGKNKLVIMSNKGNVKKILKAAQYAAEKHTRQRRKNVDATPYINHPLEVAWLLADIGEVDDEDIITAAILHDTVEVTGATPEDISLKFGAVVLNFVLEVTDDKALPIYG